MRGKSVIDPGVSYVSTLHPRTERCHFSKRSFQEWRRPSKHLLVTGSVFTLHIIALGAVRRLATHPYDFEIFRVIPDHFRTGGEENHFRAGEKMQILPLFSPRFSETKNKTLVHPGNLFAHTCTKRRWPKPRKYMLGWATVSSESDSSRSAQPRRSRIL